MPLPELKIALNLIGVKINIFQLVSEKGDPMERAELIELLNDKRKD